MSKQRIRIFVTGKVQGVFFRQALKVMAKKMMFLDGLKISKMDALKLFWKEMKKKLADL